MVKNSFAHFSSRIKREKGFVWDFIDSEILFENKFCTVKFYRNFFTDVFVVFEWIMLKTKPTVS